MCGTQAHVLEPEGQRHDDDQGSQGTARRREFQRPAPRGSQPNVCGMMQSDQPKLLDEFRNDVTPQGLWPECSQQPPRAPPGFSKPANESGGGAALDDSFDDAASVGGFSTGGLSVGSGGTDAEDHADEEHSEAAGVALHSEGLAAVSSRFVLHEPLSEPIAVPAGWTEASALPTTAQAAQTGLLDVEVDIVLEETPTMMVFNIPSRWVPTGPEEDLVAARSAEYAELVQAIGKGGDAYSRKHTQTLTAPKKNKSALARPPRSVDAGAQATAWAIDEEARIEADADAWVDGDVGALAHAAGPVIESLESQVQGVVAASLTAPGATIEAEDAVVIGPAVPRGSDPSKLKVPHSGAPGKRKKDAKRLTVSVAASRRGGGGVTGGVSNDDAPVPPSSEESASWAQDKKVESSKASGEEDPMRSSLSESSQHAAAAAVDAKKRGDSPKQAGAPLVPTEDLSFDDAVKRDPNLMDAVTRKQGERVMRGEDSGHLLASMRAVERVLVQARHHAAHRLYRAPPASAQAEALAKELEEEQERARRAREALNPPPTPGSPDGKEEGHRKGFGEEEDAEGEAKAAPVAVTAPAPAPARKVVGFAATEATDIPPEDAEEQSDEDDVDEGYGYVPTGRERLAELWTYESEALSAKGLSVTAAAWSPATPSVLAVAYGPSQYSAVSQGCLCLWSMKNPSNPAVQCWIPAGLTALAYANSAPTLLAAGMYDGRVAIFDTKRLLASASSGAHTKAGAPAFAPDAISDGLQPGCHTEAVWQVGWVERPGGRGERLVSVSTDGRVNEWTSAKGLECHTLMLLRASRPGEGEAADGTGSSVTADGVATKAAGPQLPVAAIARGAGRGLHESAGGKSQRAVSRGASGLCFAFLPPPHDVTKYLVGTEDGCLHLCSVSYMEQFLRTVKAHQGPVYRVQLSPTDPFVVLTAGGDWTVRMWVLADDIVPLKTYTTSDATAAVSDVVWSPQLPTRFASATEDGRLLLWEADRLAPVLSHKETDCVEVPASLAKAVASGGGGSGGAVLDLVSGGGKAASSSKPATPAGEDEDDNDDEEGKSASASAAAASAMAATMKKVVRPRRFTCLAMAPRVPVLAAGDSTGRVTIYRMVGAPAPPATGQEAAQLLANRLFEAEEEEEQ
jgi:hypothetical protein